MVSIMVLHVNNTEPYSDII